MRILYGLLLLLWVSITAADERILSWHSDIDVYKDGSLKVTETIKVRAERKDIKRGIYRDFPTDYRDKSGKTRRVGFELLAIKRDGRSEAHHTQRQSNGIRIYIGHKDRTLKLGEYIYTIVYRTDRQLGFFEAHDELYWNVTGNDWIFPIDKATASVALPAGVQAADISSEGYTGRFGAKGQDYRTETNSSGVTTFATTRTLYPRQALTIVVSWPRGVVTAPTAWDKIGHLLHDNRALLSGVGGLGVLLAYFISVWFRVGRGPETGVIIPHYQPPQGYSPAAMRFIKRMGYDHKTFATAIINLAVKGDIFIDESTATTSLIRTDRGQGKPAPGEQRLMARLFAGNREVELHNKNHERISGAINAHEKSLEGDYEKIYFLTNVDRWIPGIVIAAIGLLIAALLVPGGNYKVTVAVAIIGITIWLAGTLHITHRAWKSWRNARSISKKIGATLKSVLAIMMIAGTVGGAWIGRDASEFWIFPLALAVGTTCFAFYYLLKAPTRAGRRLLDKIEGFRLYLDVAEREELDLKHSPTKTSGLFEAYLPYALALDVEQQWAEQFADVLKTTDTAQYQPSWYSGGHWDSVDAGSFSSSLGNSLSSAVSSASTAPESSSGSDGGFSGSDGGGFSGGGGGGGGGGGW